MINCKACNTNVVPQGHKLCEGCELIIRDYGNDVSPTGSADKNLSPTERAKLTVWRQDVARTFQPFLSESI